MSSTKKSYAEINTFLKASRKFLTSREEDFLDSLRTQLFDRPGKSLSWSQERWMDSIFEKYSPSFLEQEAKWAENFSADHRTQALKVAHYYKANPPYYSNYVHDIFSNPQEFCLSKKEWDKFCGNKYAKKVLEIYDQDLKFSKNECIQVRANNRLDLANPDTHNIRRNSESNKVGFVLAADAAPVIRAARGSRRYQILLLGSTSPIYAHESDMKRKRK